MTQIKLNEQNSEKLSLLARRTGKSPESIMNEAFEQYLAEVEPEPSVADWKGAIMQAAGLWKDRDDLPDFEQIRRSMDRDVWSR